MEWTGNDAVKLPPKRRKKRIGKLSTLSSDNSSKKTSESYQQKMFVKWLNLKNIPHYKITNEGKRSMATAMRLKAEGLKAGMFDLCICVKRGKYGALYIEMKAEKGGVISEAQRTWFVILNNEGYMAKFARGFDEAVKITEEYLQLGG